MATDNTDRQLTNRDAQPNSDGHPPDRPMSVSEIQESYDDVADAMDRFGWLDRLVTGRYREQRFSDVEGRVLDVACGTGTNFRYVPDSAELVGVDISPAMLAKAETVLDDLDRSGTLHKMDAQDLSFGDDSFDAVISALSTCTFPDPIAALQEMKRVCKPGGTIRLVEHGRSNRKPIAWFQEWRAEAHYERSGCRWTQKPQEIVEAAGLSVAEQSTGLFGTVTTFEVSPE